MRRHEHNAGTYVVGFDPGPAPALVVLERQVKDPKVMAEFDGLQYWPNDAAIVAVEALDPTRPLGEHVARVRAVMGAPKLARDTSLVVDTTHGEHAWRALGDLLAMQMSIGATEDEKKHACSAESLWTDVRVALQEGRLTYSAKLAERHVLRSVLVAPSLVPGIAAALALAVRWWRRTNLLDCPIVTRQPTPAQESTAYAADDRNAYELQRQRKLQEQREGRDEPGYLEGLVMGRIG
jgi:hypothetical protein